jgi:hypothetical protein
LTTSEEQGAGAPGSPVSGSHVRYEITPRFKFAVIAVSCLIAVFAIPDVIFILTIHNPNEGQHDLIGWFADIWKAGVGAWLGLVVGKAID